MNNLDKYILYKAANNPVNFDRGSWKKLTGQASSKSGPAPKDTPYSNRQRNKSIRAGLSDFDNAKRMQGISWLNNIPSGPPPTGATAGAQAGVPNKPVNPNQLAFHVKAPGKFVPSKSK